MRAARSDTAARGERQYRPNLSAEFVISASAVTQDRNVIPLSAVAGERHKIIRNTVALLAEESVSGSPAQRRWLIQEDPLMRVYIIGNDGIALCREPPAILNEGEVAVASREELHAARLSGKRLLALWNEYRK